MLIDPRLEKKGKTELQDEVLLTFKKSLYTYAEDLIRKFKYNQIPGYTEKLRNVYIHIVSSLQISNGKQLGTHEYHHAFNFASEVFSISFEIHAQPDNSPYIFYGRALPNRELKRHVKGKPIIISPNGDLKKDDTYYVEKITVVFANFYRQSKNVDKAIASMKDFFEKDFREDINIYQQLYELSQRKAR
ncbi:hypothetical protein IKW73_02665 [Candidatus Saccharibacteria bacterium]|nr:hypothetical protein [Candidatus Saccharibacteria bacterium]